jgi:hypothetical protein
MAVVIDEMESKVEPETNRGPHASDASDASSGESKAQPFSPDQFKAELRHAQRRHARLRAD